MSIQNESWGIEGDHLPGWHEDKKGEVTGRSIVMNAHKYKNPSNNQRLVIKEELLDLFDNDHKMAMLVNQLLYWTPRTRYSKYYFREELVRMSHYDCWQDMPDGRRQIDCVFWKNNDKLRKKYGWIKKSYKDWGKELRISRKSAGDRMRDLIKEGIIDVKKPKNGYGADMHRVNAVKLHEKLSSIKCKDHTLHDVTPIYSTYFRELFCRKSEQDWWENKFKGDFDDLLPKYSDFDFVTSVLKEDIKVYGPEMESDEYSDYSGKDWNDMYVEHNGAVLHREEDLPFNRSVTRMYGFDHLVFLNENIPSDFLISKVNSRGVDDDEGGEGPPAQNCVHNTTYIKTITKTYLKSSLQELDNTTRTHCVRANLNCTEAVSPEKFGKAGEDEKSEKKKEKSELKKKTKTKTKTKNKKQNKTQSQSQSQSKNQQIKPNSQSKEKNSKKRKVKSSDSSANSQGFSKKSQKSFSDEEVNDYAVGRKPMTIGSRWRSDSKIEIMNNSKMLKGREGKAIQQSQIDDESELEDAKLSKHADRYDSLGVRQPEKRSNGSVDDLPWTFHDGYLLLNEVFDEVDVSPDSLKRFCREWNGDTETFQEIYSKCIFGDKLVPSGTVYDLMDRVDDMLSNLEIQEVDEALEARRAIERRFSVSLDTKDTEDIESRLTGKDLKLYRYLSIIKKLFEGEDIIGELHDKLEQNVEAEHALELKSPSGKPSDVRCRIMYVVAELGVENAYMYLSHLAEKYEDDRGFLNRWRWNGVPDVYMFLCSGAVESYILRKTQINHRQRKRLNKDFLDKTFGEYDGGQKDSDEKQTILTGKFLMDGGNVEDLEGYGEIL